VTPTLAVVLEVVSAAAGSALLVPNAIKAPV